MSVIRSDHEYEKNRRQAVAWQAAKRNLLKMIDSYGIENPELILPCLDEHISQLQLKLEEYQKRASLDSGIDLSSVSELGSRLIRARLELGLDQKELAQMLGISPQLMNKREKNYYQKTKLSQLEKTAAVLNAALEERGEIRMKQKGQSTS